jgi:ELP3 family radical SAM enzyme/protein acetyltransferase
MGDIEDIGKKPTLRKNAYVQQPDRVLLEFVSDMLATFRKHNADTLTKAKMETLCNLVRRIHRIYPNKADIRRIYNAHFQDIVMPPLFSHWLIGKSVRTLSGVKVVTIVLSPDEFSCAFDCAMCPQEYNKATKKKTQPRSYLSSEPAMLRALAHTFDIRGQFLDRIRSYIHNGIITLSSDTCEKIEVILSGGTWDSYRKEYREKVIQELFWVANTLFQDRPMRSLEEEKRHNETAQFRIIGLTLETRPDMITKEAILDYLRWGVTRIQLGIQHYDDAILKKINRKCTTEHTITALRLLKQAGMKTVGHLMPDLPGSTPEKDILMFDQFLTNPDLQMDDVKLYPTAVCQSSDPTLDVKSKLLDWHEDGSYVSYASNSLDILINVLLYFKMRVHPWIRIQRLVRDIPKQSIRSGYNRISNLRDLLHTHMKRMGIVCNCLYCKEIGDKELKKEEPYLVVRKYPASDGMEYYISLEAYSLTWRQYFAYLLCSVQAFLLWVCFGKWIFWEGHTDRSYLAVYGFLRLRIDPEPGGDYIPEIWNCGLIREVHVYGTSVGVGKQAVGSQHRGYGQRLVAVAEQICAQEGLRKMAVIAGVGTREYYQNKCGYTKGNAYMVKDLPPLEAPVKRLGSYLVQGLLSFIDSLLDI